MNPKLQELADELDELDVRNEVIVHVRPHDKPDSLNRHAEHRVQSRQIAKETERKLDELLSFYKREAQK